MGFFSSSKREQELEQALWDILELHPNKTEEGYASNSSCWTGWADKWPPVCSHGGIGCPLNHPHFARVEHDLKDAHAIARAALKGEPPTLPAPAKPQIESAEYINSTAEDITDQRELAAA